MTRYRVQQVAPGAAETELLQLWQNNLDLDCDARRRFHWVYREPKEPAEGVYLLAADDGGGSRVVGTAGATLRRFSARGRTLRAALVVDLAVEPWHRTLLPALTLVRHVRTDALRSFDFTYGFPNRNARGVFVRAGHLELGNVVRYALVLRHADSLSRVLPRQWLADLGALPLDALERVWSVPRAASAGMRFRLDWLDAPDERFEILWSAARCDYDIVGRRSVDFIRWRFTRMPGRRSSIAALCTKDGELRAYAVVKMAGTIVHCHDLFGFKSHFGPLLDLLSGDLYRAGISSIALSYFGAEDVARTLRSRGFSARGPERAICVGFADDCMREGGWLDPERWHVTEADQDG